MNREKLTPMMQQYLEVKDENPDAILFFRLGDFYEMFFDDAITASRELELTLTRRSAGLEEKAPMCGVPYHVASGYISKLIDKGYKVAICDQVEDPKEAKGIVKREVTQIITPGTFIDNEYIRKDINNYLLAIYIDGYYLNLTYSDYSTGEIYFTEKTFLSKEELINFIKNEIYRISPNEVLINNNENIEIHKILESNNIFINSYEPENIKNADIFKDFNDFFSTEFKDNLKKVIKNNNFSDITSLKKLLQYLIITQKVNLSHINKLNYYDNFKFLVLDENSKRTLELTKGLNTFSKKESLLEILDRCNTSMGSRKLKKWVESPLINREKIIERQDLIESFTKNLLLQYKLDKLLKEVYDIERLVVKISNGTINPREIYSLKNTINNSIEIKDILENENDRLKEFSRNIINLSEISQNIDEILIDNPPVVIEENRIIKREYSKELDELFEIATEGKNWLLDFENKERQKTGIKNLKVKHNKILGFFIEVTKSNLDSVPDEYIRKQTLVGSERYFSLKLKETEDKIIGSKDRALDLQSHIYNNLKNSIKDEIYKIQILANKLSELDSLISLSKVAISNNYVRPNINEEGFIEIKNGRHPIVESYLKDDFFVPNDTFIDNKENMIHIITGPNMAGKSTYMRQVALITIMAHIGSFVPCDSANISIVDRIFTRIGASDNLAKGQSTFMVEMQEVANIIDNSTEKSLLILDEVGRGTSTFDGLAIANAIIEYIAENIKAKTLFATHYHELVHLEDKYDTITNLTIAVDKQDDDIIFLRKIIKGFTNNSYGIDVARLAGIDESIINRAKFILDIIEDENKNISINIDNSNNIDNHPTKENTELNKLVDKIKNIDILEVNPLQAFNILNEIIEKLRDVK
ncbi:DNA mismatch repair protein MutS [Peptoniphilus sp. MSJ-1]|uniref:DNA mismatch repair protein MutS n=1 Tax=Peptoniphilus ovalis TaxID=2841503 RepID=A0ABS6FII5_9FIRM|nr:DNA mismatch repair protein MutS [Peptoniphilus ovalis]MBU5669046.1 DNA mismatch repair protein MutS [Peptoniphilus ovalis]